MCGVMRSPKDVREYLGNAMRQLVTGMSDGEILYYVSLFFGA